MLPYTAADVLAAMRSQNALGPRRPNGDGEAVLPLARPRRAHWVGLLALTFLVVLVAGVPDAAAARGVSFKAGPAFTDFGPELGVSVTVAGLRSRTDARVVVRASVTLVAQCLDGETGAPLPVPPVLVPDRTLEGGRTVLAGDVKPGGTPFSFVVHQGYRPSPEDVGCPPGVVIVPDAIFHEVIVEVYQGGTLVLSESFTEPVG